MTHLKHGIGAWVILSAGVAVAGEARPPVEAERPTRPPVEAAKPTAEGGPRLAGPNSGGPGSPADEGGIPAPPAESENDRRIGRIWVEKSPQDEKPQPLLPTLVGEPLPNSTKPADVTPAGGKPADAKPVETPASAKSVAPAAVTRRADPLDAQVDMAIDVTARRVLIAETRTAGERPHTPWQIGHGMLAFRRNYIVRVNGEKMDAYDWVAKNPAYNGTPWFYPTPYGARPQKYSGVMYEFEGHPNQFLAFFALARLPLDFEFTVQGRTVTFGQMLQNAKMEVNDREEVTWDLWTFAYYFDMNESWTNAKGEAWSMERLVSTTLRQFANPNGAPCGGCHALFALASARNAYVQSGNRLSGVWMQSHMHLEKYIALAKAQQNRDGSFSSNYFKGPGYISDPSKRISTSGHTLEFLMLALQQNRLTEQWVRNGVAAVARDLVQYQKEPLEVGGMYHAVHALVLYRERTRTEFTAKAPDVTPVAAEGEEE